MCSKRTMSASDSEALAKRKKLLKDQLEYLESKRKLIDEGLPVKEG